VAFMVGVATWLPDKDALLRRHPLLLVCSATMCVWRSQGIGLRLQVASHSAISWINRSVRF